MNGIVSDNRVIKGIIIEGVECSGKTTLIQRIRSDVISYDCIMLGHQSGSQFDRYMRDYMVNERVIFNRSHYSEFIYSRLWERGVPFSTSELDVLNDYIHRNFITILCTADVCSLAERYAKRQYKQKVNLNELSEVKSLFDDVLTPKADYIYSSNDVLELDKVLDYVKTRLDVRSKGQVERLPDVSMTASAEKG
ncbi:hypothetical protein R9X49_14510 [Pectobacterium carotovorum]|uniref:hypothetical protein n=1 Tax=Pectobacterium carotovorum TaxID=554 RepID=UPI0029DD346C|nr:hypothetical protein [Pectobacterium carotovorum]MDX6916317.1 hypothetical protein [Pectobacterium carotovorum]